MAQTGRQPVEFSREWMKRATFQHVMFKHVQQDLIRRTKITESMKAQVQTQMTE
jgi:hypothetical protein